jgi:hypothetical protein
MSKQHLFDHSSKKLTPISITAAKSCHLRNSQINTHTQKSSWKKSRQYSQPFSSNIRHPNNPAITIPQSQKAGQEMHGEQHI